MKSSRILRLAAVAAVLTVIFSLFGCAPGKYSLTGVPSEQTNTFRNVEVAPVEVGATTDEVDAETPMELRTAIIEAIQKKKMYETVVPELANDETAIRIESKIIELENGSQFGRWLIGGWGGKAYMEVSCRFINKASGKEFADGTFSGEISGGFFGGSPNQSNMSKQVASAVVKFLKKGK